MAECRNCGVGITWAIGPEEQMIAVDRVALIAGEHRFALEYGEGDALPRALPVPSDRATSAYPAHEFTCGNPSG